jgi:2-oxoglutarate ferredoxin oxidoreductase subunit alpha
VGGLEKEHETGNISYDSDNHERMVLLRQAKVDGVANDVPAQTVDQGPSSGKLLILGWGSTYGAIKTAVKECLADGMSVAHAQVKYMHPFPANLGTLLAQYDHVLIPEINNGQLIRLIRDRYLVPAIPFNKIKGVPFSVNEIKEKIKEVLA